VAINSTNNSIGFPGLTNNRPGMLMTVPSAAENTKVPEVKVENPVQKPSKEKMSENTKYFIGAAAIAASAIAGIYIYKGRKPPKEENVEQTVQFIDRKEPVRSGIDFFKKYLEKLSPSFDFETKSQHPVGKHGAYRIDEILRPSAVKHSEFFRKDGSLFASVDWDDDGKVISYTLLNKNGNVINEI